MSALAYPYSEPYKLPAGLLALAVHAAFFAFLYLGVSWHNEPPQGMEVEIWSRLPAPQMAVAPAPPPALQPEPPMAVEPPKPVEPQPVAPPKADIELAKKKAPKIKPPPRELPVPPKKSPPVQVDHKAEAAAKAAAAEQAAQAAEAAAQAEQAAQAAEATRAAEADLNRARAARAASATGKLVNDYVGRIRNKIKSNIIMPSNVPNNAEAEFEVTLLPDGSVLNINKVKASSSAEWDSTVERAIVKSHTLPLPPDPTLFERYFRELHLTFRPKDKE